MRFEFNWNSFSVFLYPVFCSEFPAMEISKWKTQSMENGYSARLDIYMNKIESINIVFEFRTKHIVVLLCIILFGHNVFDTDFVILLFLAWTVNAIKSSGQLIRSMIYSIASGICVNVTWYQYKWLLEVHWYPGFSMNWINSAQFSYFDDFRWTSYAMVGRQETMRNDHRSALFAMNLQLHTFRGPWSAAPSYSCRSLWT